ncbi:24819_t:CDS:2 [Entrophospora sp. SA101]|nr:24819_t:CDS:2 [Entrophospora sp. SA101]
MFKIRKRSNKDNLICQRPGCNNICKIENNGIEVNYCSSSCQAKNYSSVDNNSMTNEIPQILQPISTYNTAKMNNNNNSGGGSSSSSNMIDDDDESSDIPLWLSAPAERDLIYGDFIYDPISIPSNNAIKDDDDDLEISCPSCTFFIRPNKTVCEMCGTIVSKKKEEKKTATATSPPPLPSSVVIGRNATLSGSIELQCGSCSFINDPNSGQCEMCFLPLINKNKNKFEHLFANKLPNNNNDKIQCLHCTYLNNSSSLTCEMCHNELVGGGESLRSINKNKKTIVIPLKMNDHDYMVTQQHFRVGLPAAKILTILRLQMPSRLVEAHEKHKKQIAKNGNRNLESVTHKMFHGTRVCCNVVRYGGLAVWDFCKANCGVCGIATNGNSRKFSKHQGRMWFANSSAISLGYCSNDPIKAIFIVDVISLVGPQANVIIVDKEESLMQLKALKTLNLNTNLLSGDIPATLAQSNFQNTLTVLDLGANAFQNKIPDSISTMKNLLTLSLGKNSLNGQIPASLVKLVKLSDLVLNDNQLTGMWFANSSAISLGYCSNDPIKAIFIVDVISLVGPQANVIIVDKEEATLVKFLVLFQ